MATATPAIGGWKSDMDGDPSMKKTIIVLSSLVPFVLAGLLASPALAGEKTHKLAIQVSEADVQKMNIAINNATNVIKYYGVANVEVEIVAYGPGLNLFLKNSKLQKRLQALHALGNVRYGVCGNTMRKRKFTKADLLQDAFVQNSIVTSGVVRLMELQEQGYSYVRP